MSALPKETTGNGAIDYIAEVLENLPPETHWFKSNKADLKDTKPVIRLAS